MKLVVAKPTSQRERSQRRKKSQPSLRKIKADPCGKILTFELTNILMMYEKKKIYCHQISKKFLNYLYVIVKLLLLALFLSNKASALPNICEQ